MTVNVTPKVSQVSYWELAGKATLCTNCEIFNHNGSSRHNEEGPHKEDWSGNINPARQHCPGEATCMGCGPSAAASLAPDFASWP
jgi:hypothetical protein